MSCTPDLSSSTLPLPRVYGIARLYGDCRSEYLLAACAVGSIRTNFNLFWVPPSVSLNCFPPGWQSVGEGFSGSFYGQP